MLERAASAEKRDRTATQRDMQAEVRDRTSDLRDAASDDHERALGRAGGYASKARATAAEDRRLAAEDRRAAAKDRKLAAEDRKAAMAEIERAQMDDLTGFYRPRLGRVVLQHEIDRAVRSDGQLVFLYFDVDGLKHINDTHGHDEGDRLLEAVASALRSRLRSYDAVIRMGGDEFVAALPGIDASQAEQVARDVQQALATAYPGATISYGLSQIERGDSAASMLKRGDEALRAARGTASRAARASI